MSYILDALKKSEQERGHGEIPSVQTIHTSSLNYGNKQTYWPYILTIIVILNVAAIIYFYLNNNAPQNTPVSNNNSEAQPVYRQEVASQQPIAPATTGPAPSRTNSNPVETINAYQQQAITQSVDNYSASTSNPTTISNRPIQNSTVTIAKPEPNHQEIIEFYDLPPSTRQRLPSITVSAHVYSENPLQRSIVINNDYLEEGEHIIDDLILQEITTNGAILNYRGTVFHYEVVSGWQ